MILDDVYAAVGGDAGPFKGVAYELTQGNVCTLLQTPNLWGQDPADNSYWQGDRKPAQNLVDAISTAVAEARHSVDVSTLFPFPNGLFLDGLKAGLQAAAAAGRRPVVRVLAGLAINSSLPDDDAAQAARAWLAALAPPADIPVYAGVLRPPNHLLAMSWNHSKLVIVDGQTVIGGGHNQWGGSYCSFGPVHDLSVRIQGPAAHSGVAFLDRQWRELSAHSRRGDHKSHYGTALAFGGAVRPNALPQLGATPAPATPGGTRVLALGRLGIGVVEQAPGENASRTARLEAMKRARRTLRFSQQDIGSLIKGIESWDEEFQAQLVGAAIRGVEVFIVISDKGATAGDGESYSWGLGVERTAQKIKERYERQSGLHGQALIDALTRTIHIAPVRFCTRDDTVPNSWRWRYQDKVIEPGNHAKCYIVDEEVFFVGSDNAYPIAFNEAGLQEYGFLMEGESLLSTLMTDYWSRLWSYSSQWQFTDWARV